MAGPTHLLYVAEMFPGILKPQSLQNVSMSAFVGFAPLGFARLNHETRPATALLAGAHVLWVRPAGRSGELLNDAKISQGLGSLEHTVSIHPRRTLKKVVGHAKP